MTISRYEQRRKFINARRMYKPLFDARDVRFIRQYNSPSFDYPTDDQINSLNLIEHTWSRGNKLSKLAEVHYGNPRLWWVIAWFNKRPTEAHIKYGDTIQIPSPLERVIDFMGI